MINFPRKRSLRKKLRRLFASKATVVSINLPESTPQGIARTQFEDNTVHYSAPVKPSEVYTTTHLVLKFGRKQPVQFKQITTAFNTFKSQI